MKHGEFEFNENTGDLIGPKDYLESQGEKYLEEIRLGKDPIFNTMMQTGIDKINCVLACLQADYAGFKGINDFTKTNNIGA